MTQSTSLGGAERPRGRLLYRGAEADLVRGKWQGLDAVYKIRRPLKYRLPALDEALRHQRTVREADMIAAAKRAGVRAPYLYNIEPSNATLVMEFVEGERLKESVGSSPVNQAARIFNRLGRDVAKLHSAGIMHGDLTTANVVRRDRELVFLDFGLSLHSNRVEDQAVDLRLIKETIVGAHSGVAIPLLRALFDGYGAEAGELRSRAVLRQLRGIERRGRYARVT